MGLKSYVFSTERPPTFKVNNDNDTSTVGNIQFHFWNKHVQLDEWMRELAIDCGFHGDFNGVTLGLDIVDLTNLATSLIQGRVYPLDGEYFYIRLRDDLEFIAKAMEQISEGRFVYYTNLITAEAQE